MAFSDWVQNPDWIPVVLVSINYGHRIDGDAWARAAAPNLNCWWISHPEGEPSKVESNGIELTEAHSLADCDNTLLSWYFDPTNDRLYLNITGSGSGGAHSDDPGSGAYIILAYLWERLTSRQFEAPDEIVFNGRWYLPYIDDTTLPDIEQAVGNYLEGASQQQFNNIDLLNDGYWDQRFVDYIYEGKELVYELGAKGAPYVDYIRITTLITGNIEWTDTRVSISLQDQRR